MHHALEHREPVELALLELEDLLVLGERRGVVVLAVEQRLRARHVRVGHEARARELLEDAVEPLERLVRLLLLVREEAVDVEREVVLREPGIILEHAREIARRLEVRLRRRSALVDGLGFPRLEALDELLALELPLELAEAEQRLGHLAGVLRRLADERGEEADRLGTQRLDLRDVPIDARLELLLELLLEGVGDLGTDPRPAPRALERRCTSAGCARTTTAGLGGGLHVERLLGRRLHGRTAGARRRRRGRGPRWGSDAQEDGRDEPEAHTHDGG